MPLRRSTVLAWAADALLVAAFGIIGRASHGEDASGTVLVILPFFAALQVGWLLRSGRSPVSIRWAGLIIWAATVLLGIILRAAIGEGIAIGFIVVTAITLGAFLLGWRAIVLGVGALRRRRSSSTGTGI